MILRRNGALLIGLIAFAALSPSIGCGSGGGATTRNVCGDPGSPPGCGNSCTIDDDCGFGSYCGEGGTCVAECIDNTDCSGDFECDSESGRCFDPMLGAVCAQPNPPPACGDSCSIDADCGVEAGAYCFQGTCVANCEQGDTRCPDNFLCNTEGKCVFDNSGCEAVAIPPERQIPNIVFVLDRSGSMAWEFANDTNPEPGELSRWQAVKNALHGTTMPDGLLYQMEDVARLNLAAYDKPSGSPEIADRGACAVVVPDPMMSWALGNATEIDTALSALGPGGRTPTAEAMDAVVGRLQSEPPPEGDTVIVLATDGAPNGCDHNDEEEDKTNSIDAVSDALAAGYPTFVIGVASDASLLAHLQDLADAGIGGASETSCTTDADCSDPDEVCDTMVSHTCRAPLWDANSPTALADALEQIFFSQIPCTVTLSQAIEVVNACDAAVTLGGEELVCGNTTRGWEIVDEDEIKLLGTACDDWRSQPDISLEIVAPCDIVIG